MRSRSTLDTLARLAVTSLVALAIRSSAALAIGSLRVRGTYLTGLRVEDCAASGRCSVLVRYPLQPARTINEVEASPSGRYFFVWSTPDRRSRELEVFEITSVGPARLARWSPGFGGELRWVDGDHLFHSWGCGTSCVNGVVYDVRGHTALSEGPAAWLSESPDHRYAAFAYYGGAVVVVRFANLQERRVPDSATALFPTDIRWRNGSVRVQFDSTGAAPILVSALLP